MSCNKKLLLKKSGQDYAIKIQDIMYIDVLDHRLTYHCKDCEITVIGSMKKIEEDLEKYHFVRIHHSFAVNMQHIREVQAQKLILKNGRELPLSRSKKGDFRERYSKYWEMQVS